MSAAISANDAAGDDDAPAVPGVLGYGALSFTVGAEFGASPNDDTLFGWVGSGKLPLGSSSFAERVFWTLPKATGVELQT